MNAKKVPVILGAIAGVILIAIITATVLTLVSPKDKPNQTSSNTSASPEVIINELKKADIITQLSATHAQSKPLTAGQADITYTKNYLLTLPATHFVQFEQKDTSLTVNNTETLNSVAAFLTRKGLSKATSSQPTPPPYIIFDGKEAVCQLLDLPRMNSRAATLTVSCIKKQTVVAAFEEIDSLMALYAKSTSKTVNPTTIKPVRFSEDNKTLMTLYLYGPEDSAVTALFAAIDDTWEYLGTRPLSTGTTQANPQGLDRSLSTELKEKIANPKYEGFLQKYVF